MNASSNEFFEQYMKAERQLWNQWLDAERQFEEATRPLWQNSIGPVKLWSEQMSTLFEASRAWREGWIGLYGGGFGAATPALFDGYRQILEAQLAWQRQCAELFMGAAAGGAERVSWEALCEQALKSVDAAMRMMPVAGAEQAGAKGAVAGGPRERPQQAKSA